MSDDNIRRFSLFPKPLAKSLEKLVRPVYKKHGFAESRILTEWTDIVGRELAECSIPQKLVFRGSKKEEGTLHILAASGRALELQHMQPVIIDRIATYFGYNAVTRLVFTQTSTPLFRRPARTIPKPETAASPELMDMVKECEDEDVRSALLSLGMTLAIVEK